MALRVTRPLRALSDVLWRTFPTPELIYPRSVGVDISDTSIKWLILASDGTQSRVSAYGDEPLTPGIVVEGEIKDIPRLIDALHELKKKWQGVECAHAALPEEAAYVFNMFVPEGTGREQTLRLIEFDLEGRVPIPPSAAVYDFDVIEKHAGVGMEIGVFVFPIELAESYVEAFRGAGITLLSLEIEARSIARAVTSDTDSVTMIVDSGRARSGIAVVKRGIPIFTTTVAVGGDAITKAVEESLGQDVEVVTAFKNDKGLYAEDELKPESAKKMIGTASALAEEVARHYRFWDTRRDERDVRTTPVEQVILVGGSCNLKGLDDFIAGKVQADASRGNIWRHVSSFDRYIPPIDLRTSMQYATAVGLALRATTL